MKGRHKVFLRNTSNIDETGRHMINLPQEIWKQMKWNINENLVIDTIKHGLDQSIIIKKELKDNE